MIKLFYRDKDILFTEKGNAYSEEEIWREDPSVALTPNRIVDRLKNHPTLAILSPDPQATYRRFVSQLDVHPAAGGLVRNDRGAYLLMRRNDRWDLPKGHWEAGETMEECALREVSEECGIHGMHIEKLIGRTEHIYRLEGWILKSTLWYAMRYEGMEELVPQTEEGITDLVWVDEATMREHLNGSYATMRYLMEII